MGRILLNLFILLTYVSITFASDTLIVKTVKVKGFGPFRHGVHPLKELTKDNPWYNCKPDIKGIPDTLKNKVIFFEQTDFWQYAFQCFKNKKIGSELFSSYKTNFTSDPDMAFVSQNDLKVSIPIVAGFNAMNQVVVVVDRNNNYDLSDDPPYIIPPKLPGQIYWGRYHDGLPFEIKYEYFNGKHMKTGKTWIYVDYDYSIYNLPDSIISNMPVQIAMNFAEHRVGTFNINGQKYELAIYSTRPVYRSSTILMVKRVTKKSFNEKYSNEVRVGEKVRIGNFFYRFEKVLNAGESVMLTKLSKIDQGFGTEIGSMAFLFTSKSINGELIDLKKLRGNYVLLDFWGTWCAPCVAEIPTLKEVLQKYGSKNFKLIGIANDTGEKVKAFVNQNEISWPQILQQKSKEIINLYNVKSYPTTFLIDPEGRIIAKNIRGKQLKLKLAELLGE